MSKTLHRNLYSEEDLENETHNVPWVSLEDYVAAGGSEAEYGEEGNNNRGPLTALRILKDRTSNWTNIPTYSYTLKNDADGEDGTNSYDDITVTRVRARLPRLEELMTAEAGCAAGGCQEWLYENLIYTNDDNSLEYWTSTANSTRSHRAWTVSYYGIIQHSFLTSNPGILPVIELSK